VVGLTFALAGALYWVVQAVAGWPVDYAGVTMLLLLGVATSILAYVLIAGSPND
jgi:hypothetical protein